LRRQHWPSSHFWMGWSAFPSHLSFSRDELQPQKFKSPAGTSGSHL
jgi:hypothetical protein